MTEQEARQAIVTRTEAIREIKLHSLDPQEFFDEAGDKPEYRGDTVLNWLGY